MKARHEAEAPLGSNGAQKDHDQDQIEGRGGEGEKDPLEHAVPYQGRARAVNEEAGFVSAPPGDDEHLVGRDLYGEPAEPNALERARPPVGVGQPPIAPQPLAQVRESVVLPLDATELYDKARLVEEARKRSRREVEEMLRGLPAEVSETAFDVGSGDGEQSAAPEKPGRGAERAHRIRQVFDGANEGDDVDR